MEAIQQWLGGNRPYSTGVALYQAHGSDKLLKRLFEEGYSDFKYKKLQEAMEKLQATSCKLQADTVIKPAQSVPEADKSVPLIVHQEIVDELQEENVSLEDQVYDLESEVEDLRDENQELKGKVQEIRKGWPAVMDDTLKGLHDQWLQLFSEKKNLQSRLLEVATAGTTDKAKEEEAGTMAHRILDLRDACRKIYQKRDYYLQHHQLPQEKPLMELPTDPKLWPQSVRNYKRYIRKNKALLEKNPNHPTAQKQIDKYQWGVDTLQERLGYIVN